MKEGAVGQKGRARPALARADLLRETCLIGGEWVSSDRKIEVHNPATGRLLGRVPDLAAGACLDAIEAASAAGPAWRARTGAERAAVLRRWFDLVMGHADDLATILTAEQGKPLKEAQGEIAYAASYIEWFAEEARRVYGEVLPSHQPDKRNVVIRQPVGVVAAVTPWNFPAAMITRKVAPALATGCTVVLKPSELTPFTALALGALAEEAGVPAGVLNIVTGEAAPIGEVLTTDPRVRKFTFTGSTAVGKMLAARCMGTVKRVSLELGGNAPFIVFDDADLDLAIEGAMASKFRNTGQTCVCANRFFVQAGVYDAFAAALALKAERLTVGDGLEGETQQGPLINAAAVKKVCDHVQDAVAKGARILTGGEPIAGPFFAPTVIVEATPDMRAAREETFGPVAILIRFDTEAEVVRMANAMEAGLASYVFTSNIGRATRVSEALECGMVGVNTGLISSETAPFGGMKESGLGREGSRLGLDDYLDVKYVCTSLPAVREGEA